MSDDGNIKSESTLISALKRICTAGSIPIVSPHDLRHTFATIMAENEVNLKELANVLGHRTGEFTLQVYVEQKPEIHEGVSQYFDLLARLTGIQTDEDRNLCLEKTVNDVEGYTVFLDSFIGDALE